MIFKDCYPAPALQHLVQIYRLRHFVIPDHLTITAKPYPTRPEQCIAFYIRGFERTEIPSQNSTKNKPRSVITGQYTERINRFSGSSDFLMIQVVFLPGALYRLTGIPSYEIQNGCLDLEDVFPAAVRDVNERLQQCNGYHQMITAIESFLLAVHKKIKVEERPADEIFRMMLYQPTIHSIDWLAKEACLSPRQFERKAADYIGISPKLFTRISRFVQSYDMRLKHPQLDWLSIAVACHYHDYQHLAKDYKEFAGASPNKLFAAESDALERRLGLNR